jgi:branched-chain amino acid transport system ATP-binding protein
MSASGTGDGRGARGPMGRGTEPVLSVDEVAREAEALATRIPRARIGELAGGAPLLELEDLFAGYGKMEILHGFSLAIAKGRSLCLIGPNGAGKSTVLHSIYGFTRIFAGTVTAGGRDITRLSPNQKLMEAGIAYILQDNSVFPDMTVRENLLMGGYLLPSRKLAGEAADRVLERYPRLAERAARRASVLSGGERRLLEISRALIMDPKILLVDEPSIGLEPRFMAWCSRSSPPCSTRTARPSSWSNRTRRRVWNSPTPDMSWSRARWRSPGRAASSSRTSRWAGSSSAAEARAGAAPLNRDRTSGGCPAPRA